MLSASAVYLPISLHALSIYPNILEIPTVSHRTWHLYSAMSQMHIFDTGELCQPRQFRLRRSYHCDDRRCRKPDTPHMSKVFSMRQHSTAPSLHRRRRY